MSEAVPAPADDDGDVLHIPIGDIAPNPFNERDMGDLAGLAASITRDGVLEPATVCTATAYLEEHPEHRELITARYVLIFGERRWRASLMAGQRDLPCLLRDDLADSTDLQRVQFAENYHRKQATPIEEARMFARQAKGGMSYRQIAAEWGTAASHISRRVALLALPHDVQRAIDAGQLGADAGRALRDLDDPEQQSAAWRLIEATGIHVEEAKARVLAGPVAAAVPASHSETPAPDAPAASHSETAIPAQKPAPLTWDREDKQRQAAAADRQEACKHWLSKELPPAEQLTPILAGALLTPMQQNSAHTLALAWLRATGKQGIDVTPAPAYFQTVLDRDDEQLHQRAALAVALAAAELRAASKRRPVWDGRDIAYVKALQDHAGYVPETPWERKQLNA
ncbi:ParB/RepB/Spo0J family partition protein [Actinacidiphila sp. bgisy160]|uniref:ParB/RepB/Spo0J family partition protein n=1 Tax=Actinacidiphila sp. bgisy160 TaxID=3413796 RepID=UPI003D7037BD